MSKIPILLFLVAVLGCAFMLNAVASDENSKEKVKSEKREKGKEKGPRLVLTAYPRQGFMPFHVSFNANLENVSESDAEYYCLHEEWDFGDGAVSAEQPNCEPFVEGSKINLHFFAEHTFDDYGSYTVRFSLGDPIKIRSNQIGIVVLERDIGR